MADTILIPGNTPIIGPTGPGGAIPTLVSIAAIDANASETGSDPGVFRISRFGDTATALNVGYLFGGIGIGQATMDDYTPSLTGLATILAGADFTDITIIPVDDTLVEGPETVNLILNSVTFGSTYTLGTSTATVTIADNDVAPLPTVTISAPDPNAAETLSDPGVFRISRTGATTSALNVNYGVTGTATSVDYSPSLTGLATIPVGATFANITITPVDDALVEGLETVNLTLSSNAGYALGSPTDTFATVTIADNDVAPPPTVVSIVAQNANTSETPSAPGVFRISRTGDITGALTVNFNVSGTSSFNDFTPGIITPSVTIAANQSFVDINVAPVDDLLVEGPETVILTLNSTAGYTLGANTAATVTIADNDVLPTVSIVAQNANTSETLSDPGVFRISRTGDITAALTVNYAVTGTATGTDYTETLGGTATIAAGALFTSISISAVDDALVEGSETVVLTLNTAANYILGTVLPNTATVTIADNDFAPVDRKADIVWRNDDGGVSIWQMDGNNVLSNPFTSIPSADPTWKIAGTGDFDNDKKSDILWRNDNNGGVSIWKMDGTNVLSNPYTSISSVDPSWKIAGTGDFNNDKKSDILWRNDNGQVSIWQMDGTTVSTYDFTSTPDRDNTWKIAGTGDFGGDGKSDILWRNDDGSVSLWQMNGLNVVSSGLTSISSLDASWKIAGTGDFNNDQRSDILWRNDDGSVKIWQMNGLTVQSELAVPNTFDATWKIASTGDFSGDGQSDILWRNNLGQVSISQINGSVANTIATATSIPFADPSWKIAGTTQTFAPPLSA